LTVLDMAKLLGSDDPAVKSVLPEARATLEELGAAALLARLDELTVADANGAVSRAAARDTAAAASGTGRS
jgi:hypothetical protein